MNTEKQKVHFTDNYLISSTNPISVNLIGAGGTGSKVLTALMEMNHSLIELGHAGLQIRLWDDDIVLAKRQKAFRNGSEKYCKNARV